MNHGIGVACVTTVEKFGTENKLLVNMGARSPHGGGDGRCRCPACMGMICDSPAATDGSAPVCRNFESCFSRLERLSLS